MLAVNGKHCCLVFITSLLHAIVFYGSFNFVEIAFAHFVCKVRAEVRKFHAVWVQ